MKSSPYKILLNQQSGSNPKRNDKRSSEEIQILTELIKNNQIFEYLHINESHIIQICKKITLIWAEYPHQIPSAQNQIYLILDGTAFEYMYNPVMSQKIKNQENNNFVMLEKLKTNSFFIDYYPEYKIFSKRVSKKYQIMADYQTLIGKISGDLFDKIFQPLLANRWKQILEFSLKVRILSNLPKPMVFELSKYFYEVQYAPNEIILHKQEKSSFVYFIQSGEIEQRICNIGKWKNPTKNSKTILKQNDSFGINNFDITTFKDVEHQYEVEAVTQSKLFRIDKRILAIVISSFDESNKTNQFYSSIYLNNQITDYCEPENQSALTKNASMIKSSEKKVRDIKLRNYGSSKKINHQRNEDQSQSLSMSQMKYSLSQNLTRSKEIFHGESSRDQKFEDAQDLLIKSSFEKRESHTNFVFGTRRNFDSKMDNFKSSSSFMKTNTSGFFSKKRKSMELRSRKIQTNPIKDFLDKKLNKQMLTKAEMLLQKNFKYPNTLFQNPIPLKQIQPPSYQRKTVSQQLSRTKSRSQSNQIFARVADSPFIDILHKQRKIQSSHKMRIKTPFKYNRQPHNRNKMSDKNQLVLDIRKQ